MSLMIHLSPETEKRLLARATAQGQNPTEYVQQLIEKDVKTPSLGEILAPVRQEFRESGMTEEELETLIEECRGEVWQEFSSHRETSGAPE